MMVAQRSELARWLKQVGTTNAMEALVELVPAAVVFVVDRDRNVLLWSQGAERILGFPAQEVLGEHCRKSNRCQPCVVGCGIAEHGTVNDVPLTLYRSDSQPVRLRKHGQAFFDEEGAFAGGIEVLVPDPTADAETGEGPGEAEAAADALHELAVASDEVTEFHGMVSREPAMLTAFQTIRYVAETETTILVRGESGTGKELVARAIHEESHRRDGPFVAVNCAALTPTLLESELFGHLKGSFTGAVRDRQGLFQQASSGTLFLDEVGELPLDLQAKLLRVLEEQVVVPLGGTSEVKVDVRVISATHRALREEVRSGRFREDLMYRLRVVPLFLPPLRKRRADIEPLLWYFVRRYNERGPRRIRRVAPEVMRALLDHHWPGNVRELKNVVEYAFAVGRGVQMELAELPPEFREERREPPAPARGRPPPLLADDEAQRIGAALEAAGGHLGKAAELLGISRPTLWRKRKKYGI